MYTFFPLPRGSYVARSASSAYSLARDLTLFWSQDLMLLLRRSRRRVFLFPLINPKPECRSSRVPLLFLIRTQKLKKRQQDLLNNNNNNDVDHYLPFLSFPFLSFHWLCARTQRLRWLGLVFARPSILVLSLLFFIFTGIFSRWTRKEGSGHTHLNDTHSPPSPPICHISSSSQVPRECHWVKERLQHLMLWHRYSIIT